MTRYAGIAALAALVIGAWGSGCKDAEPPAVIPSEPSAGVAATRGVTSEEGSAIQVQTPEPGTAERPVAAATAPDAPERAAATAPEGGAPMIPSAGVGRPAPAFTLKSHAGEDVSLADFRGKKAVLLAFYPKAFTPGCTTEMSTFRDEYGTFGDAVQIFGVSMDAVETLARFRAELNLPFPLLADTDGKVSRAYDAIMKKGPFTLSSRELVLIDRDGRIVFRDDDYHVGDEGDWQALVAAVARLGPAQ